MRKAGAGFRSPLLPLFAYAALSLVLSAGCVTRPSAAPSDPFSVLDGDASVYVVVPSRFHRQLLELVADRQEDGDGLLRAFDRTDLVYGSRSRDGSLRILATGSFPRGGSALYFPSSKGWKKTGAPELGSWYASPTMDAAVPRSGMVLLSSPGGMAKYLADLKTPVSPVFPDSFGFHAANAGTDGRIGVYIAHAEFLTAAVLGPDVTLPVAYAEIYAAAPAVDPAGTISPYLLSARVVLQDARTARAMSSLLRVATGSAVRLDGDSVFIDSFPVPEEKLAEWAGKMYFY